VTRIVLADDESITVAATGFPADCSKNGLEWCVRADVGSNQIWVKPEDSATHNNLELKTNKRDYSIEFRVLDDVQGGIAVKPNVSRKAQDAGPMYRVIYRYPVQLPPLAAVLGGASMGGGSGAFSASGNSGRASALLATARPVPKNWKYSMQLLQGGEEIKPSLVFDDGRYTYMRFPGNRPVPAVFYISPTGEELHVNFHMDPTDKRLLVVERMGARFVLRLGGSVVGLWNDGYNPDDVSGDDSDSGTTVEGVTRVIR
jgi:type IV secretion system protein VirB9